MNKTAEVNDFMEKLDHPLKPEVQVIRDIIKGVNKNITEQIKWNAPSFSYKGEYQESYVIVSPKISEKTPQWFSCIRDNHRRIFR